MRNIKSSELSLELSKKEWTILYINTQICKACDANKHTMEEIVSENPEINIVGLLASEVENQDLMKSVAFDSLPYFAIFHSKKEGALIEQPMTCFIGGETGAGKEIPMAIIQMIRMFQAKNVLPKE